MKSRIGYVLVIPTLLALMPVPLQATVELEWFGLDEPPSTSIFRSIGPSELPGAATPVAISEWPVEVNMALLAALPEWIDLNLPDQSMTTLIRDRGELRGPGAFVWSGHGEECSAIFTAYSSPNRLMGTISCLNGNYRVGLSETGARLTRRVYGDTPVEAMDDVAMVVGIPPMALPEESASLEPPFSPLLNDRIDVLILYTPAVTQAVGSANVQVVMQHIIDQTQQAMINSASAQTGSPLTDVHLAHAQEVPRGEMYDMNADLNYLQGFGETSLPVTLRAYWRADIVMLIRESMSNGNCGLAYTPGYGGTPLPADFADFAVGVTVRDCVLGDYPFQHEFGHILGGNHNIESNLNNTRLQAWALAHWANPPASPKGGHRTLLSYKFDAVPPNPECDGECPQILHYANAEITYYDPVDKTFFQTGVANVKENARTIALVAPIAWTWSDSLDRIFADGFE